MILITAQSDLRLIFPTPENGDTYLRVPEALPSVASKKSSSSLLEYELTGTSLDLLLSVVDRCPSPVTKLPVCISIGALAPVAVSDRKL